MVKAWLIENGAKASGGSAIRYPTPQALNEYAEASIRDLGTRLDARHVLPLYQSALAADTVLHLMNDEEKKATQNDLDCLRTYMQAKKMEPGCRPLQASD